MRGRWRPLPRSPTGADRHRRCEGSPRIVGVDRHPWAIGEAAATYRAFKVPATVRQGDIASAVLPKGPASILAAFTMNELGDPERDALFARLLERARQGDRVLIVEPLAGFVARW